MFITLFKAHLFTIGFVKCFTYVENKVEISHQTQRMNLSGQVVYLLRQLERESTCFGVMEHFQYMYLSRHCNLSVICI